jgi:hypothetical protein
MVSRGAYFKEYNQKPERKEYLNQKSLERYYKNKKGVGNLVCPNCQTVQEFNLIIKKKKKKKKKQLTS